ncbi:hypothetical protein PRVXH_000303 [Proteinivorax hydrogeniformans]|uniref:Smr domain-containing protein n=1 Tax=Proteinivorax hydrogeniformans TaxID=1826727 RepID=A0AAU8HUH0_9FIRM
MNYEFKENEVMMVDLHTFNIFDAQVYLERLVTAVNARVIKEIIIIHGHRRGKKLQKFVRTEFKNSKIERKLLSLNPGRTSFILKQVN